MFSGVLLIAGMIGLTSGRWIVIKIFCDAGWSSQVARWAHNPKVGGSNPPPATSKITGYRSDTVACFHFWASTDAKDSFSQDNQCVLPQNLL